MAEYIKTAKPNKNKFDLSREVKMTMQMGKLYPAFIQDIVPGDSFRGDTQQMIRVSPLLAPVMHNIDFKMDYFFVPYRLLWDNFKEFITGGEDGDPTNAPSYPRFQPCQARSAFWGKKSLADYMGLPVDRFEQKFPGTPTPELEISALPFRAYQLIWHEYFRDQNVGSEYTQHTGSGIQSQDFDLNRDQLQIRYSNWEKDYFTSALPFLQRGPEVELPLGTVSVNQVYPDDGGLVPSSADLDITGTGQSFAQIALKSSGVTEGAHIKGEVESVTINELRKATALQRFL